MVFVLGAALPVSWHAQAASDWQRLDEPVFTGQYIASDPAILVDGALYRMFYTCWIVPDSGFVAEEVRAAICQATSPDGLAWTNVDVVGPTEGLMLRGIESSWEEHLEASYIVKIDDTWLLYYSGYQTVGDPAMGYPAALSIAASTDGVHFERVSDRPNLSPTPGWYDNDAIYSPTIVWDGSELVMIYAGHCYTMCDLAYGNTLLTARSSDGLTWIKDKEPAVGPDDFAVDWLANGAAEPGLIRGPDSRWYLFITGLNGEERAIGVAVGNTASGPWTISAEPVLEADGTGFDGGQVLAPMVLIEGDRVRMWYLGFPSGTEGYAIGYAEADWTTLADL